MERSTQQLTWSYSATFREIILVSKLADENGISEMTVNLDRFSAIDESGSEYFIKDFSGQMAVQFPPMETGKNIRTKSILQIPQGMYTKLRFYLKPDDNVFTYRDRSKEIVFGYNFLEFDIKEGMKLDSAEESEVLIRFDFPKYQESALTHSIRRFFRKMNQTRSKLTMQNA